MPWFIININEKNFLSQNTLIYTAISREGILLIETFSIYAISEYYCKNRELKKSVYQIVVLIILSLGLIYYFNGIMNFIRIIYFTIELPLFIRIIKKCKTYQRNNAY